MKSLSFLVGLMFSLNALAATKSSPLLEVNFEKDKKTHQYLITQKAGQQAGYVLSFKDEKHRVKSREISRHQAELIKDEATRIIWENQYRKSASSGECREYMNLKTDLDNTKICYQNPVAVGRAFGFINSLHATVN
jgi:hypothetical protein